jgi:predicted Rossmann fold nucleotide-binding protein DprA/Smf involved in DNA uptake
MNFAQMLMQDVKPLPAVPPKKKWVRSTEAMSRAKHSKTVEKYCAAIGKEWVKTADVAERLKMARMSIFHRLVKYHEKGILDRRPLGGKPYNHHTGWEWKVK